MPKRKSGPYLDDRKQLKWQKRVLREEKRK